MAERIWNDELKEWIFKKLYNQKLCKGAEVRLKKNSRYSHQNKEIGTLVEDFIHNDKKEYSAVEFKDGSSNRYRKEDLELANPVSDEEVKRGLTRKDTPIAAKILKIPKSDLKSYLEGSVTDVLSIPESQRKDLYKATGIKVLKPEFKLPVFGGKELFIFGEKYKVNFLKGKFGLSVLDECRDRAKFKYGGKPSLDVLRQGKDRIIGENYFSAVLVNEVIRENGLEVATLNDLENILHQKALDLSNSYNLAALVLRTRCGNNADLSGHLSDQIKERDGEIKYPVMIPLSSLELDDINSDASKNSSYGLAFKLREGGRTIYSPELSHENNYLKFDITGSNGMPHFIESGSRTLSTVQFGLAGVHINGVSDICSSDEGLGYSGGNGGVVIIDKAN